MRSAIIFLILALLAVSLQAAFPVRYDPLDPRPRPVDPPRPSNPDPMNPTPMPDRQSYIPCYGSICFGYNTKCCAVKTTTGIRGRCINPSFDACL